MNEVTINTKYKDSVFRMLFNSKEELLSLYNAVNVNKNHRQDIMNACKTLKDYSIFVGKIRRYVKEMSVEDAVDKAIDECIKEDVLADFLRKNRAEVCRMSVLEYNEELHLKTVHDEGYEKAKEEDNAIIAEKDAALAEKDNALAEKDARIAELEALLAEKDRKK